MGTLKDTVTVLKALADEGRLRIVMLLGKKDNLCVCEIKEVIGLSQPTISSHLKLLQNAGILESKKDGLWVNYSLAADMDDSMRQIIGQLQDMAQKDASFKQDIQRINQVDRHNICKK